MPLARNMTRRIKRSNTHAAPAVAVPPLPSRGKSVKSIDRSQISAPVALVSTTNVLSYNAPDIASYRKPSLSSPSTVDVEDSDHSVSTRSRASSHASRETVTDASSVSSSPISLAPNHPSGYFVARNKKMQRSASSSNLQRRNDAMQEEPVPAIPERAHSHSKRAHVCLAQKRSLQSMSPHSSTRSLRDHSTSPDMFTATIQEEPHPFGKELEQLSEVVEEFGDAVRDAAREADVTAMRERNLASFCAADYLAEIQPLFVTRFGNPPTPAPLAWI